MKTKPPLWPSRVVQDGDGEPAECDQANTAGGLGLAESQLAMVVLELLANQECPVVEV